VTASEESSGRIVFVGLVDEQHPADSDQNGGGHEVCG
jgi:hypothetical protein